jgi:hypothetical protein
MTYCTRNLARSRRVAARNHDTVRVVGREFVGNASPNYAIATNDENLLGIHAASLD